MLPGKVLPFTEAHDRQSRVPVRSSTVIQIGRDQELLRLRARLIASAGYAVHSISPDQATAEIRKPRGPKVWVFCHTLELAELARLAVAIRNRWPGDKLLRLTDLNDITYAPGLFDEFLEPVKGVDDLLRVVADLAKQLS